MRQPCRSHPNCVCTRRLGSLESNSSIVNWFLWRMRNMGVALFCGKVERLFVNIPFEAVADEPKNDFYAVSFINSAGNERYREILVTQ